jgi:hypothetical protein
MSDNNFDPIPSSFEAYEPNTEVFSGLSLWRFSHVR